MAAPDYSLQIRKAADAIADARVSVGANAAVKDSATALGIAAKLAKAAAPGRYPKSRTTVSTRQDRVELAAPWAIAAEYGSWTTFVYGRKMRDQWGIWPARVEIGTKTGWIVGAAWRIVEARATGAAADEMLEEFRKSFNSKRIPKGL